MHTIKSVKPNSKKYFQGYYGLINPEKYVGNPKEVIYRSSYEHRFMVYCDTVPMILKWSSEPLSIPYISPIDNKEHKYYIDFFIKVKNKDDIDETILIEVKPKKQLERPILEGTYQKARKLESYNKSMKMYIINVAKFAAAKEFAKKHRMQFKIITEDFLFKKEKK